MEQSIPAINLGQKHFKTPCKYIIIKDKRVLICFQSKSQYPYKGQINLVPPKLVPSMTLT